MHGPYAAAKTRDLWTRSREAVLNDGPLFHVRARAPRLYGQRGLSWFNKYPARGSGKHRYHATLKPTRSFSLSAAFALEPNGSISLCSARGGLYMRFAFLACTLSELCDGRRPTDQHHERPPGDKTNLNRRSFVPRLPLTYTVLACFY